MVATLARNRENEPLSLEALRSRLLHGARNFRVGRVPFGLDSENLDLHSSSERANEQAGDLDWPELADLLPDGGFPRGVVELSSPHAVGGATAVAFAAIRSVQKNSATQTHPNAIPAAWIDTDSTLFAPGVARAGIDLTRLFVVRPPRAELGRIAVKVARSGAFELLVVDVDAIAGVDAHHETPQKQAPCGTGSLRSRMEVVVRKLALAAEDNGMTVILITDAHRHRAVPWPVAMRLELERRPGKIGVRVAKERHGRIGAKSWIALPTSEVA